MAGQLIIYFQKHQQATINILKKSLCMNNTKLLIQNTIILLADQERIGLAGKKRKKMTSKKNETTKKI